MSTINPHKGRTGLNRIKYALSHSKDGLMAAFLAESAFRQEVLLALVLVPLAMWVAQNWLELALLIGSVLLVLIVELLNSGIEAAIDRISFEHHELSKRAKDMGSAAVLIALVLCALVWSTALWARLS
jgi:diacylglycerol kinase (ATP)